MTRPSQSDNKKTKTKTRTMKKKTKFQVFEFNDDESIEQTPKRFSAQKLGNHGNANKNNTTKTSNRNDSPITKYHFLQSFARGTEVADHDFRNESIDVDSEGCRCTPSLMSLNGSRLRDGVVKAEISGLDAYLISSSSSHKSKKFRRVSSETISTEMSSSPTSTFCSEENQIPLEKQKIVPDCGGYKIDDKTTIVNIFPDFIVYRDICSMESCLTFSGHCIKLEGSPFAGTGKFYFEWAIGDVAKIESEWSGLVETARVVLHLKPNTSQGAGNGNKTSDVEQLLFSVYDPHWAKIQEAIKTLDVRYKANWNIDFDAEMLRGEKHLFGQSSRFSPRCYISCSDEPFQDVIYPEGDPDAVTISKRDVELLQPETFINDTIIDFYIKYLANKIQNEKRRRFHFFNSFFFRKLADLDKDPSSAHEGKAAFQRVRKWTKKVSLFEKDYIFIPVNYSLHWSLLVICHPGEAPNLKDEECEGTSKVPCILHMDSIKGSHKGLNNLIQSYLCEEWKERHSGTTEDVSSKFLNLRFIPLELPQQENLFDCGIFLLHYVELFLEEAPLEFSPFNISKFSKFLSRKWFPPEEASLKRSVIKKLIDKILEDPSLKIPPADSIAKSPPVNETGNQETEVIFLEKIGSPVKTCNDTASSSNAEKIGISLPETSLLRGDQCFRDLGASPRSSTDANLQLSAPNCSSILSPIEEAEEVSDHAESPLDVEDCKQVQESTCDLFSMPQIKDVETLGNHEVSMQRRKFDEGDSVSITSSGSQNFSEIEIYVALPVQDIEGCDHLSEPDKEESSSTSCEELFACVVQDSEDEDSDDIKYLSSTKKDYSTKNIIRKRNNLPSSNDNAVSESDELQTKKRGRLKAPEGGRRFTRSFSKALHL